jgi:hypothetical protein
MILRSLLYLIAAVLIIGWAISYFVWKPGPFIHLLAALAVAAFLIGLTRKDGIG